MTKENALMRTEENETGRVEAFSDGVFAVSITLLAFNLQVPKLGNATQRSQLRSVSLGLGKDRTCSELLLKNWRRPADPLPFQADIHLDAVGYLDERNVAIHAVVLAVECHDAVDAPGG